MAIAATDLLFRLSLATTTDGKAVPSCGGNIDLGSPAITTGGVVNEVFDRITSSQATNGNVEYRLIFARNEDAGQVLYDALANIVSDSSNTGTSIKWALDAAAVNGASAITLLDEADSNNQLAGLTFGTASLPIGDATDNDLPALGYRGIWLERTTAPGTASDTGDTTTLSISGDTV